MLFSRSITAQFTSVFVIALLLVVASFYVVLDSVYRVVAVGESADLGAARINRKSRNEGHQLFLAPDRLRESVTLAIQRLAKRQPPAPGGGQAGRAE